MSEEGLTDTAHEKIFIGKPIFTDFDELQKNLKKLEETINNPSKKEIKEIISQIVDTYKPDFQDCISK